MTRKFGTISGSRVNADSFWYTIAIRMSIVLCVSVVF